MHCLNNLAGKYQTPVQPSNQIQPQDIIMAKPTSYRRKQYFIQKEYQTKFILKLSALILAGTVISTVLILYFSQDTLTSSYVNSRLEVKSTSAAILPAVMLTNAITVTVIFIAAVVVILFISHKIAGPMYRFEKEIKKIDEGDISGTISLRDKDQFEKLAQSLDGMVAGLRQKITLIQDTVDQALGKVENQEMDQEMLAAELRELKTLIDSQFKR